MPCRVLLFQEYGIRRGDESEAAYNMGRTAHQLGLHSLAVSLYHTALQPALQVSGEEQPNMPWQRVELHL